MPKIITDVSLTLTIAEEIPDHEAKATICTTCRYIPMAEGKISICSKLMAEEGLTIAFAESAIAGWLCS